MNKFLVNSPGANDPSNREIYADTQRLAVMEFWGIEDPGEVAFHANSSLGGTWYWVKDRPFTFVRSIG